MAECAALFRPTCIILPPRRLPRSAACSCASPPPRRGRRGSPRPPARRRARCRRRRTRRAGWSRSCGDPRLQRAPAADRQRRLAERRRQILRVEAQRLDDQAGRHRMRAAGHRLDRLPPRCVRQAEPHPHRAHRRHRRVAQERLGGGEPRELDPLLLGVAHLAHRAGHVGAVAAIQAAHRVRALPHGGAHAIHRGVAAAHHHHVAPCRVQGAGLEIRHRVAQAVPVRREQVVQRRHDPRQAGAGAADVARLVDAGGDQHAGMARAQVVQADVAADLAVQVKDDPGLLQQLPAPEHDVLFQLEVGDAVDHQAADPVVPVVDVYRVAQPPQLLGRGQPARPGADDAHRDAVFLARAAGLDPTLFPGGVGDEPLDGADGDALEAALDDAVAFAQPVLRADAAADFGKVVGGAAELVGFLEPSLGGQLEPVGDVVRERAMDLAERHAALAAPAGLRGGGGRVEIGVDFREVGPPHGDITLVRRPLRQADELQHALGHDRTPRRIRGNPIRARLGQRELKLPHQGSFADASGLHRHALGSAA